MMLREIMDRWFTAAGVQPLKGAVANETLLTELVVARVLTTYLHFHSKCGVVHDDMHVGNIILTLDEGHVKIIDWELARLISPGGTELKKLWTEDPGQQGVLIRDRGTQCDSLFRGCVCSWPYQIVGAPGGAACNLFGLSRKASQAVLDKLAKNMPLLPAAFLGEHATVVKELRDRFEL